MYGQRVFMVLTLFSQRILTGKTVFNHGIITLWNICNHNFSICGEYEVRIHAWQRMLLTISARAICVCALRAHAPWLDVIHWRPLPLYSPCNSFCLVNSTEQSRKRWDDSIHTINLRTIYNVHDSIRLRDYTYIPKIDRLPNPSSRLFHYM